MTEPELASGQTAPEGGQPAEPTSPPEQPSGQPVTQGEPYWKSQYDTYVNQSKDAIELRDWINSRPDAKKLLYDYATGKLNKPEPQDDFNPETDFDPNEAFSKPNSKSGKYLRDTLRSVVRDELEPVQTEMRSAQFRQKLADAGVPAELHSKYEDFLTNMENHMDVVYGPMAQWYAQYAGQPPPSQTPSALQSVRSNKNALPPMGTVQGAPPAPVDITEEMFQGILKGVKPTSILDIGK